jgi:hypothetical protein
LAQPAVLEGIFFAMSQSSIRTNFKHLPAGASTDSPSLSFFITASLIEHTTFFLYELHMLKQANALFQNCWLAKMKYVVATHLSLSSLDTKINYLLKRSYIIRYNFIEFIIDRYVLNKDGGLEKAQRLMGIH